MDSSGIGKSAERSSPEGQILRSLNSSAKKADAKSTKSARGDSVNVGMADIYKSLTVLGDTIIRKLDELLKSEVPGGIASLKPEEHTPEATAQRIVDGVTGFFGVFSKQNPGLAGEELLSKFMSTIRGGISQGYNQAAASLGDIGAFEVDGVKSGIEETMRLVEEKLKAYEESYRKNLNPTPEAAVEEPSDKSEAAAP